MSDTKKNPTGDRNEQGVAPPVSKADDSGQPGTIRELPADRKPDPSTIASEQLVDDDGASS